MAFVKRYLIPRLIQYFLVIWLGITVVFLIPRLTPNDPIMRVIGELRGRGSTLEPGAMDGIIRDLTQLYGLEGSWLDQYWAFWGRLFRGDLGVSFFQFPARVNQLIAVAMPWTLGLLLTTTAISWIVGNIIGGLAGYYSRKSWSRILDAIAMVVRPLPYYIFAFALLLLFAYVVRWFPITGGASLGAVPTFTWAYIKDVLWHSFLPALSLCVLGGAVTFQTMKLIVQNVNAENFVQYAKMGGVTEDRIVGKYVIRNAVLPQITGLALSIGQIFSGALITEIVYGYPGLGMLLYRAIVNGDYNLIMGITLFSIIAITTAILIVDLTYPLFDPRVRYK
ncbi:ABC-type dipeptide/oligopeptide/nickel transport systems, permease components [Anaerolinea thermolimosa]|uniref:ABC transporter permease n=1 Tax=Anaerolinea thermolimosa TaxID=229919 RepID=UPI0007862A4B|nr:ABC transporter permease [Anaerolinea thermolimosa]GAP06411.1 ABC-type dipeptide/oligopeptide/nickel transport systems, permease components [Anaerolinea thermolimosa]